MKHCALSKLVHTISRHVKHYTLDEQHTCTWHLHSFPSFPSDDTTYLGFLQPSFQRGKSLSRSTVSEHRLSGWTHHFYKRSVNAQKVWTFYIPDRRWNSKIVWKRSWSPRIHCEAGTTCKEGRSQRKTSRKLRDRRNTGWRRSSQWLLVDSRRLHLSPS